MSSCSGYISDSLKKQTLWRLHDVTAQIPTHGGLLTLQFPALPPEQPLFWSLADLRDAEK